MSGYSCSLFCSGGIDLLLGDGDPAGLEGFPLRHGVVEHFVDDHEVKNVLDPVYIGSIISQL